MYAARIAIALALLIVAGVASADDPGADPAAAEYERIEREFGLVPRGESLAAIDALAARHLESPLAARALVWRGQLALVDGDLKGAERCFEAALARGGAGHASPDQTRFALRGLGDVGWKTHRLDMAEQRYVRAREGADPLLDSELVAKLRLVAIGRERRSRGTLAGLAFLAALAWFAMRARRGSGILRVPSEAIYAVPIFALLLLGARSGDRRVIPALVIASLGALALIIASGVSTVRSPPKSNTALAAHAAIVAAALAALFYLAACFGDLIDLLRDTFTPGNSGAL